MMHPEKILRALEREYQESRDSVWTDDTIPWARKQSEVDRLWREFDAQRTELREGTFQGKAGVDSRPALSASRRFIPRKRRRLWK